MSPYLFVFLQRIPLTYMFDTGWPDSGIITARYWLTWLRLFSCHIIIVVPQSMCELIQTLTCFICVTSIARTDWELITTWPPHTVIQTHKVQYKHTVTGERRQEKTHTHQWPLLNLLPLSEAQTANERAQSRPFKFIWTDVIKLTHGVGWILGRLLPKLSFPKHCHLPSLQMNQLQSSIILLGGRWMHTSPLAGAGRLKGLIGAGDIKAGGFICHIRTTANQRVQAAVPALAVLAYTMKYYSKW